jgi:Tfp pilus assembly protein PilX
MLLRRSNRPQRGYTIAELLSVVFVLALITTAVALIIGPLLRAQAQTQAKVDTVQAADMALYRIERDLRNTDSGLIYACTTGASPTCTTPATSLTAISAIVMPSAYQSGNGQFQLQTSSGSPKWQGATVYWVDSKGNLDVAFDTPAGYTQGNNLRASDAANAVKDVTASSGMQLARFVEQLSVAVPGVGNGNQVDFQLQAKSTVNGALNETTYHTHVETRN